MENSKGTKMTKKWLVFVFKREMSDANCKFVVISIFVGFSNFA
jgi:hypothetical protein